VEEQRAEENRVDENLAEERDRHDLRMLLVGAAAWAGCGAGRVLGWWTLPLLAGLAGLALAGSLLLAGRRSPRMRPRMQGRGRVAVRTVAALGIVLASAATVTLLRLGQVEAGPVARLAEEGAAVRLTGTVTTDPRTLAGRYGEMVVLRVSVEQVTGRGRTYATGSPILVFADAPWRDLPVGEQVAASGTLAPAEDADLAAVLSARGPPRTVREPDIWWRGAAAVRAAIREAVAHRPPAQRALVPALVDGDDTGLSEEVADDFRATGLTHLLAVSGTNLTLVVGFLLILARWVGLRGRALLGVGALGIVGFVLLARTEPSVVRAAAMGTVGLVAMGAHGRRRGARALGVAVTALLLLAPGLAVQVGFALSVLATGGIVLLAPAWRDALARWLPRPAAEAVAVPAAAQLACTPVVAAISGQVSLVAVVANLVAAPAVAPATVLGLGGGLLALIWVPAGQLLGTLAGWCVAWIVVVAQRGADLPGAAVGWGTTPLALLGLSVLTVVLALGGPLVLRRPATGIAATLLLVVTVLVRPPTPGWPPEGWVLVACDVGQGDALVVRTGPAAGIVVDAGPDPAAVDACLDRLGVRRVPLVVLTHLHADHVDGLTGVLDGREVAGALTTPLQEPAAAATQVRRELAEAGVGIGASRYAATQQVGEATVQVLWPPPDSSVVAARAAPSGDGDGGRANDASVVILVEVRGVRILLTGDIEPAAQTALARRLAGLTVDVLKVPHHGSRYQDREWLLSLQARVALVSVGADNDYGHPAPEALEPLSAAGARVLRTDRDGDLAVLERGGRLLTESR